MSVVGGGGVRDWRSSLELVARRRGISSRPIWDGVAALPVTPRYRQAFDPGRGVLGWIRLICVRVPLSYRSFF